jgi:hypothetical protein
MTLPTVNAGGDAGQHSLPKHWGFLAAMLLEKIRQEGVFLSHGMFLAARLPGEIQQGGGF